MSVESNKFEDFLLSEYQNIAQAHFKSIETISSFFRYYLLIMSIPVSAIVVIFQITNDRQKLMDIVQQYNSLILTVFFSIAIIGICVFWYIINLRLDTVLYARTVNGIRKYFYEESGINANREASIRVLPQSTQFPAYFEWGYFVPVVSVFAIVNTLYFFFAIYLLNKYLSFYILINDHLSLIVPTFLFFLLHYLTYWLYTYKRENAYLKSNSIIGIDIDGVINKHREQFCQLLRKKVPKEIDPNKITVIPVHKHPSLGVTRDEEKMVFNDPKYWTDMPVVEDAPENMTKLEKAFGLVIYMFTDRPWPVAETKEERIKLKMEFLSNCKHISLRDRILKRVCKSKMNPLRQITKEWLCKYKFPSPKRLTIEKGKSKNRFSIARKKRIKFFVEDDLEKAIKMSYICDVVFLLSHPYNEPNHNLTAEINGLRSGLPSNIIRVKDWSEIYQKIGCLP